MRRRDLGLGLLALPALVRGARAEASGVRIVGQYGLPYLPLMVMEHEKLVEKHAAKLGLPSLNVSWPTLGGPGAMIDGLLSGGVDFGVTGAPGLLTLWDKTRGTPREMRALSCVQLQPFMLVTNDRGGEDDRLFHRQGPDRVADGEDLGAGVVSGDGGGEAVGGCEL